MRQARFQARTKSLEALKHKVLKPKALAIDAVRLEDCRFYSEYDFEPERVKVYAVTGAGNILYSKPDGSKDKDAYDSLRLYDSEKIERFKALKAAKAKAEADLNTLLSGWPKLKAKALYAGEGVTTESEED